VVRLVLYPECRFTGPPACLNLVVSEAELLCDVQDELLTLLGGHDRIWPINASVSLPLAAVIIRSSRRHQQRKNQGDLIGHSSPLRIISRGRGPHAGSTGNDTPSMVLCCSYHLSIAGNSGTASIWPQRKLADAILVKGGHRRHPASGLNWGHRLQKRMAPLFMGLIAQSAER
jgi:hypothetical protein